MDSKPFLPLVLAGQSNLYDSLMYPGAMPLASRVVAKSHFAGIDREEMKAYLLHHLNIAGITTMLFDDTAVTAIHQGSGGIYRKANNLARELSSPRPLKTKGPSMPSMSALPHLKSFNRRT